MQLKKLSGKKILFPATTRWNSIQITYARIVEIGQSINQICLENDFPIISKNDFTMLESILAILTPFKGFTDKLQQDSNPSISLLYPGLHGLVEKLEAIEV
jgi:hypothetical protein